ncbi:MAG: hypothetical protein FGM37_01645, partial [Phycisphaerales bacterium]|nr:hypothetical protein [Phycisphaerales bacterium]
PATGQQGYARFSLPTDTIRIAGNTAFPGLDFTYEMVIRLPSDAPLRSIISEQRDTFEDKVVSVSSQSFRGSMVRGMNCGDLNVAGFPASLSDRWAHLAWVRTGSVATLYLDGQPVTEWNNQASCLGNHSGSWMAIGMFVYGAGWFPGSATPSFIGDLDWLRISKVARYSGPFVPPCETSVAVDADTELMLRFNDGPGVSVLHDESPNAFVCSLGTPVTPGYAATSPLLVLGDGGIPPCPDCNTDGILDADQVARGELADYNSNRIPDCCEAGAPCVVGNHALQWRADDGGNGHWYLAVRPFGTVSSWTMARDYATARGGYLVTVTSAPEQALIERLFAGNQSCQGERNGVFLGARQEPGNPPGIAWSWVSGEPWAYTNWASTEPNDFGGFGEDYLMMVTEDMRWYDIVLGGAYLPCAYSAVIEWSADCNGDGIVDYGQILRGQLLDVDANGVPDTCECQADVTNDGAVNGVDLAAVLGAWGTDGQGPFITDIDGDGIVSGTDLAFVLGGWGPCQ